MSLLLKINPQFKPAFDGIKIASDLISKFHSHLIVYEAYLFGSSATGQNTSDSDLDILVVIPDSSDKKEYYNFVGTPFFSPIAADWIFVTQTEFNNQKIVGGVCRIASMTGTKIYDAK